jgi:hypothetical protein
VVVWAPEAHRRSDIVSLSPLHHHFVSITPTAVEFSPMTGPPAPLQYSTPRYFWAGKTFVRSSAYIWCITVVQCLMKDAFLDIWEVSRTVGGLDGGLGIEVSLTVNQHMLTKDERFTMDMLTLPSLVFSRLRLPGILTSNGLHSILQSSAQEI